MATDNVNLLLDLVRRHPGKTRPELQKMAKIPSRGSMQSACEMLVSEGFVSLRNDRHFPTEKGGVHIRFNRYRGADEEAAIAIQQGRDPVPSHAAKLYAASELQKAVVAAQKRVDEKYIADAKATADAVAAAMAAPPVPVAVPAAQSLFEGSPASHLGNNVSKALTVHDKVLSRDVLIDETTGDFLHPRQAKLQVEAATATLQLATKIDENSLRAEDLNLRRLDQLIDSMISQYNDGAPGVIEHE